MAVRNPPPNSTARRRRLRRLGAVAAGAVALVLFSTAANLTLEHVERSTIEPYGERIQISGGSVNVHHSAGPGETIVLLGGLGTPSPALDFAPLIRVLDDYNVVVVEGFGYGYADQAADDDRTVENIADELHETLGQLGIGEPYVLAGHSLAGYYMLSYANQYPEEVSAVIGIDPTLPSDDHGQGAAQAAESSPGFNWGRLLSITGLVRWTIAIAPGLAEPDGSAFTPDELERMRLMASWNWDTPAVVEETARMGQNGGAVRGLTYPDELPVLTFLARGNGMSPDRLGRYEERLRNVRDHKIVVLDGGHYLHWTHSAEMAEQITAFLSEH